MRHFSIRDLFWLTLVVALSVGWWANRQAMEARHDEALKSLKAPVEDSTPLSSEEVQQLFEKFRSSRPINQQPEAEDDFKIEGPVKVEFVEPSSKVRLGSSAQ